MRLKSFRLSVMFWRFRQTMILVAMLKMAELFSCAIDYLLAQKDG